MLSRIMIFSSNAVRPARASPQLISRSRARPGVFCQGLECSEFFRRTCLEDLKKNRPEFFADATSRNQFPSMNDPDKFRHELVPELAGFISENYEMAGEVEGVRIYRLRD